MKWSEIQPRMFVVLDALDHCEHGEDCGGGGGPTWYRDYGSQRFRVRGQVCKIDAETITVEGSWQWIGPGCEHLPIEHNCFTVVRGAVEKVRGMT